MSATVVFWRDADIRGGTNVRSWSESAVLTLPSGRHQSVLVFSTQCRHDLDCVQGVSDTLRLASRVPAKHSLLTFTHLQPMIKDKHNSSHVGPLRFFRSAV